MKKIIFLPGDGIGQEVSAVALEVLEHLAKNYQIAYEVEELPIGGASYSLYKKPLTDKVLGKCLLADAVFLGAVGGRQWDELPFELKPERALLKLRHELGLYANLRPVKVEPGLVNSSPLRPEIITGVDLMIVRELTGGIYFGEPRGVSEENGLSIGINTMRYSEPEIRRIATYAFKLAQKRKKNSMLSG